MLSISYFIMTLPLMSLFSFIGHSVMIQNRVLIINLCMCRVSVLHNICTKFLIQNCLINYLINEPANRKNVSYFNRYITVYYYF